MASTTMQCSAGHDYSVATARRSAAQHPPEQDARHLAVHVNLQVHLLALQRVRGGHKVDEPHRLGGAQGQGRARAAGVDRGGVGGDGVGVGGVGGRGWGGGEREGRRKALRQGRPAGPKVDRRVTVPAGRPVGVSGWAGGRAGAHGGRDRGDGHMRLCRQCWQSVAVQSKFWGWRSLGLPVWAALACRNGPASSTGTSVVNEPIQTGQQPSSISPWCAAHRRCRWLPTAEWQRPHHHTRRLYVH